MQEPTPDRIMQFTWGFAPTFILATASHFKLFDTLAHEPKPAADLAAATGTSPRGMTVLCDALVAMQLLDHRHDKYHLTPESDAFLVTTKPAYQGGFLRHIMDQVLPHWMQLREIVRTGRPSQPVNQHEQGTRFFTEFVESILPLSYPAARELAGHLNLSDATQPVRVLDIASGSGVWGIALAQASRQVTVTAVDWPDVLEVTAKVAAKHGVADQFKPLSGDILEVDLEREHYHIATLGHILHSEGPERSRRLLHRMAQALAPGGTIAIMDFLPDENRKGPLMPLLFAVNMLVNTENGGVYTFAEISAWLDEAGFKNPRLLQVSAVSPLILADR